MAQRTYSVGMRTFEITLSGTPAQSSLWTIQNVKEPSDGGREIPIPGMGSIVAPTESVAFARACDCIDKWLMSNRSWEGVRCTN